MAQNFLHFFLWIIYFCLFQLLEEEVDVPVSTVKDQPMKEETRMDTDEANIAPSAPTSTGDNDTNMQDAKGADDAPGAGVENGVPDSGDNSVQMETDAKVCIL